MKQRITREEREISIQELWWYTIRKWKWLIAGLIIGALLLGAYSYYSNYKSSLSSAHDKSQEEILKGFSDTEQQKILAAVNLYEKYTATADDIDTDYVMMLDAGSVYKISLQYMVDTDYIINLNGDIESDYTTDILEVYNSGVRGQEVRQAVLNLGIEGLQEKDLEYLVISTYVGRVLEVDVYGEPDDCVRLTEVIKEYLESSHAKVSKTVGEHKLSLISENGVETYGEKIKNAQTSRRNDLTTINTALTTATKNFTEEQTATYNALISKADSQNTETNTEAKVTINKKYVVLGGFVGFILVAFIAIMCFMFGRKFNSTTMAEQVFNVDLIGKLLTDSGKNKLDCYFDKKLIKIKKRISTDKQIEYITETIAKCCAKSDKSSLYLCSSRELGPAKTELINKLLAGLNKAGISTEYGISISDDVDVLKKAVDIKNIVFIESLNMSENKDIINEINTSDRLEINILGMIAVI